MRVDDFFQDVEAELSEVADAAVEVDAPFFLARNVYRLRIQHGLTQEDLAHRVGTKQPRIAEIERGDANPRLETLAKLARALEVEIDALLAHPDRPGREAAHPAMIARVVAEALDANGFGRWPTDLTYREHASTMNALFTFAA